MLFLYFIVGSIIQHIVSCGEALCVVYNKLDVYVEAEIGQSMKKISSEEVPYEKQSYSSCGKYSA